MTAALETPAQPMQEKKTNSTLPFPGDKYQQYYAEFMELAAHDLYAPLRKLGVLTDRLIAKYKSPQSEEVDQYTRRIHDCIAGMQSLVENFTEFGAVLPESMHYEICNPDQIIKNILQESNFQSKLKEATISIGETPLIQADKIQLRLLFKKLLENSFTFSKPEIPVKIDILTEELTSDERKHFCLDEGRSYCKIILADNGIGFEPGDRERIFQPLVRLHGKSAFPGNGLGLALVKRIVDNHQGIVYASGTRDAGAAIVLIIPQNQD